MNILQLILILLLALIITAIFTYGFNIKGPWGSFWTYFLMLFLSMLAISVWLIPAGPHWQDVYWLPPVIAGILVALMLAAATPPADTSRDIEVSGNNKVNEETTEKALVPLFWLVLALLLAVAVAGLFILV